jgi:CRISPR system Cascade subunit CasB
MNPPESPLVDYLEQHREDRAMLAALRRGLGRPAGMAAEMFPYVIPFVQDWNEDDVFLVAALFALHPASAPQGNMGDHSRKMAQGAGDDASIQRRFVQLLNMRRDSLATPLRQQIGLLKSQDIAVNWRQLQRDVQNWDHPDRFVQKAWARAYWAPNFEKKTKEDTQ